MNIDLIKPVERIRSTINFKQQKEQQEYINDIQAVKGDTILYTKEGYKWNYQEKVLLGES